MKFSLCSKSHDSHMTVMQWSHGTHMKSWYWGPWCQFWFLKYFLPPFHISWQTFWASVRIIDLLRTDCRILNHSNPFTTLKTLRLGSWWFNSLPPPRHSHHFHRPLPDWEGERLQGPQVQVLRREESKKGETSKPIFVHSLSLVAACVASNLT